MRACNPHPRRLIRSRLLGLEKRRILLQAAGPLNLFEKKTLDQGGKPGDLTGRPEDPINPGGKVD